MKKHLAYRDVVFIFFIMTLIVILLIICINFSVKEVAEKRQIICMFGIALLVLFLPLFRPMFSILIIDEKGITKKNLRKKICLPWEEIKQIYVVTYSRLGPAVRINASEREMDIAEEASYSCVFTLTKGIKKSLYEYCPRDDLKIMIEKMKIKHMDGLN